ncbi:hypothetical protein ACIQNT_36770 [Streptomyces luteogriseus]|uniref:hypothetical protein n=1 Tax=Streptomyces luteogriseus TaxID=68233 RepID=UPI00381E70AA
MDLAQHGGVVGRSLTDAAHHLTTAFAARYRTCVRGHASTLTEHQRIRLAPLEAEQDAGLGAPRRVANEDDREGSAAGSRQSWTYDGEGNCLTHTSRLEE